MKLTINRVNGYVDTYKTPEYEWFIEDHWVTVFKPGWSIQYPVSSIDLITVEDTDA